MITKVQSETTYEVQYEGRDFMVTVFQDIQSGIIEYDTFDCETCADVDGDLDGDDNCPHVSNKYQEAWYCQQTRP